MLHMSNVEKTFIRSNVFLTGDLMNIIYFTVTTSLSEGFLKEDGHNKVDVHSIQKLEYDNESMDSDVNVTANVSNYTNIIGTSDVNANILEMKNVKGPNFLSTPTNTDDLNVKYPTVKVGMSHVTGGKPHMQTVHKPIINVMGPAQLDGFGVGNVQHFGSYISSPKFSRTTYGGQYLCKDVCKNHGEYNCVNGSCTSNNDVQTCAPVSSIKLTSYSNVQRKCVAFRIWDYTWSVVKKK